MMSIDEAIIHAKEVAEENRGYIETWRSIQTSSDENDYIVKVSKNRIKRCESCAQDHEQLAAWLEELKERRAKDEKYKWHDQPEEGWTEETLPEVGEQIEIVIVYINESEIAYHTEYFICFMNETRELIDTNCDFVCDVNEIDAWRLHKVYEEET